MKPICLVNANADFTYVPVFKRDLSSAIIKYSLVNRKETWISSHHPLEAPVQLKLVKWLCLFGAVVIYFDAKSYNEILEKSGLYASSVGCYPEFFEAHRKLGPICDVTYSHPVLSRVSATIF